MPAPARPPTHAERDAIRARWSACILQHRAETNKTQQRLADELGVSVMAISTWELAKRTPTGPMQVRLINHLKLNTDELFAPLEVS